MSYPSRSPDCVGSKRKRPAKNDYFDNRQPSMRTGNLSSPNDHSDPKSYSPPPYDRRDRSPRRVASYHPASIERYTTDEAGRPRTLRLTRDRSSSPGRNRGGRRASGHWDETDRERFVERVGRGEAYRPKYPTNDSPTPSPSRPGLATHESRDSRTSSVSNPHPNQPNKTNDSIVTSKDSIIHPNQSNTKDSIADQASSTTLLEPLNTKMSTADPEPTNTVSELSLQPAVMTTSQTQADSVHAAEAANELGQLFYQLIEEATDLASLKTQKGAAERDFARRDSEFNKSKANHEKFPATEEALRRGKDQAKKTLHVISEKCEKKDSTLKDIALQGAARLLSALSLEKRCQTLEKQVRDQQSFIENQRSEREALETKIRIVETELATVRDRQEQLHSEIRPRVDDAHQNALKSMNDLEDLMQLSLKAKEDLADLSGKIPQNLEQRLDNLSERVSNIKGLDNSKAKEELSATTGKALAENMKALDDYGQRLQELETYVHGSLNNHLSSVLQSTGNFRQELQSTHTQIDSLVKRIKVVEGQYTRASLDDLRNELNDSNTSLKNLETRFFNLPSNMDLVDLRERIAFTESGMTKLDTLKLDELRNEVNDSRERLGAVEKQTRPNMRPSAVESLHAGEQIASLERRLSNLESARSSTMAVNTLAPEFDYESLKKDIIAIVESMESASDSELGGLIDALEKRIEYIEKNIESQQNSYAPISTLSTLNTKLEDLSRRVQIEPAHGEVLRQMDGKYNQWTSDQQNIQQDINDRIEVVTTGIVNVQKRLDLINTKDLAIHMLDQMDSTYPNLRDAQNTLTQHQSSLRHAEIRLLEMDNTIKALKLEGQIMQDLSGDTKTAQALRKEVDALNANVTTAKRLAEEAKDAIDAFSKGSQDEAKVLGDRFGEIYNRLHELQDQQKALATVSPVKSAKSGLETASPAVENRPFPNGNSTIRGRSKLDSPISRQSSGEPLPKKRRQQGANGLVAPTKPNGAYGSPGRKRKRVHLADEDDSDDVDFEPDQPTISDDEDD